MSENENQDDGPAPLALRPSDAIEAPKREARALTTARAESSTPAMMSDETGDLWRALAKAQANFDDVKKTRAMTVRGEIRYHYANLSDVVNAVMPALKAEGFVCSHIARGNRLHVRLIHAASEQWIEGVLPFVPPTVNGPEGVQALGSLLTYLRRYLLSMLLGVVAVDDDDDGNAAMGVHPDPEPPARNAPARPAAPKPDASIVDPLLLRLRGADNNAIRAVWDEADAAEGITPTGRAFVRAAAITQWTAIAGSLADCDGIARIIKEQGFPAAAERRMLDALNSKARTLPDEGDDPDDTRSPD